MNKFKKLTEEEQLLIDTAIEESAIMAMENSGVAQDIFHPDYGWILKNGERTEAGDQFVADHYPDLIKQ